MVRRMERDSSKHLGWIFASLFASCLIAIYLLGGTDLYLMVGLSTDLVEDQFDRFCTLCFIGFAFSVVGIWLRCRTRLPQSLGCTSALGGLIASWLCSHDKDAEVGQVNISYLISVFPLTSLTVALYVCCIWLLCFLYEALVAVLRGLFGERGPTTGS